MTDPDSDLSAGAETGSSPVVGTPWCPFTSLRAAELLLEAVALNRGDMLLDSATGLGHCAGLAGQRGVIATGIDSHEGRLDQARRHYPNAMFYAGIPESLVFADGFFAACVQHAGPAGVPSTDAVAEAHRVLMPGGRFAALCLGALQLPDPRPSGSGSWQIDSEADSIAALNQAWSAAGFTRIRTTRVAIDAQPADVREWLAALEPWVRQGLPPRHGHLPPVRWTAVLVAGVKPG